MTTNLLAIETSQEICSVGLLTDGTRIVLSEHVRKKHNERLLGMLSELREAAGFTQETLLKHLQAVAFGRGPGSFTGVRIAAAAAQAIALAADATMIRVSSSEAMAVEALKKQPEAPGLITAIRSRRDLYYLAAYENDETVPIPSSGDRLIDAAPDTDFDRRYRTFTLVGETPEWWTGPAALAVEVDAHAVLDVADRMLARGQVVDPADGLPEYFTGDSPWRKST